MKSSCESAAPVKLQSSHTFVVLYTYNSTDDPIDENQVLVLMAIVLFLSTIGLAAIYFQWSRLRQRLGNKRQDDLSENPTPQLAAFTKQIQIKHKQSYHDLVAQVVQMRNMQNEVRATLSGLQTAVSQIQARESNDKEENIYVEESSRAKLD
jgi:hypothetical protein